MKQRGKFLIRSHSNLAFRRTIFLSVFFVTGMLLGCFVSRHISAEAADQLRVYLNTFVDLNHSETDGILFFRAAVVYFRYLLLLVLFSFSTVGIYFIPAVFAAFGFSLAFAMTIFSRCIDGGILVTLSLFSARCLFVLPMTLYFGCVAILSSGRGKEGRNAEFWRRLAICTGILLLGTVIEVTVVPKIFDLLFQTK